MEQKQEKAFLVKKWSLYFSGIASLIILKLIYFGDVLKLFFYILNRVYILVDMY